MAKKEDRYPFIKEWFKRRKRKKEQNFSGVYAGPPPSPNRTEMNEVYAGPSFFEPDEPEIEPDEPVTEPEEPETDEPTEPETEPEEPETEPEEPEGARADVAPEAPIQLVYAGPVYFQKKRNALKAMPDDGADPDTGTETDGVRSSEKEEEPSRSTEERGGK